MPKWIHDRAEHLLAKNPSMPKSMAFAVATQQSHALGKSPKGYGTAEGRAVAKAKFDTPKDDKKTANPGGLESPKMAEEHKLQGHTAFQGIAIAVENRKGSVRKGVDSDGKPWRTVMKVPYGYLKGTRGADGEEVDVFVGPKTEAPDAYVVHQRKADGTGFDEDKVILGVESEEEAKKLYLQHYNDPKFLGPISVVPIERLKKMIEKGKTMKKISSVQSFIDELFKMGATRAVKEWRSAMGAGDAAGAAQIAQGYGQLGLSPRYLQDVSSGGMEAGVDLMMGRAGGTGNGPAPNPSGLVARKLYKSDSPIATGENMGALLSRKKEIVDTARGLSPEAKEMVPAMYGHRSVVAPSGQVRHVSEHEYVPDASSLRRSANSHEATQRFQDVVAKPLEARGMAIGDVPRLHSVPGSGTTLGGNTGNVIMQGSTPKMIDFMPETFAGPSGGVVTSQHGKHDVVSSTAGSGLSDSRFSPGTLGRRGTVIQGGVSSPSPTGSGTGPSVGSLNRTMVSGGGGRPAFSAQLAGHEGNAMRALRKDVFNPAASVAHSVSSPLPHAAAAPLARPGGVASLVNREAKTIVPLKGAIRSALGKIAFATNEYSGPMGPVIFSQASQLPGFRVPSLKTPVEKPQAKLAVGPGWIGQRLADAVEGMRAAGKSPKEMLERAARFDRNVRKSVKSREGGYKTNLGIRLGGMVQKVRAYNELDAPRSYSGGSGPVDVLAGYHRSIEKSAVAGFTPAGRLAATKRIGTGFGRSTSGPSIAEISKIPGPGRPLPGAVKDTI